jgi:predicted MFS family arabinose efflux permease
MAEVTDGAPEARGRVVLSRGDWTLLLLLAGMQFTHLVDFIMIMPLGPTFLSDLAIDTTQFGMIVSSYGFAAAIVGLLAAPFLDRFDRKTSQIVLYAGFLIGTLLCAVSPNYETLVAARAVAGGFGGLMAANILAIVGDVFGIERRGTAMGIVMWGFSLATVLGVPVGLVLAEGAGDWRVPFAAIGGLGFLLLALCWYALPPLRGHLRADGVAHPRVNLWAVLSEPTHVRAYALSVALVMSTFLVIPFLAVYMVANIGRPPTDLKYVYVFGGLATLVSGPLIGWLADRYGKMLMLKLMASLAVIPILLYTNLPPVSLAAAVCVATLFMVIASGRMVPATALITASAAPRLRGGFLSVNSAIQQTAMGLGAVVSGKIVTAENGGPLHGFATVGLIAACAAVASVVLAGRLRPAAGGNTAPDAEAVAA